MNGRMHVYTSSHPAYLLKILGRRLHTSWDELLIRQQLRFLLIASTDLVTYICTCIHTYIT